MRDCKTIEKLYHTHPDNLTRAEFAYMDMLVLRDVQTPCKKCGGRGVRTYGNTSTWKGGIGGQAMTTGVCDACWGSGDANRPWANLRKLHARFAAVDRLVKALRKMEKQNEVFRHVHSPDMGGRHGLSIRVPQGKKGAAWHDAAVELHNALTAFDTPEPTDAEIEAAIQAVKYPNGPEDKLIALHEFTWDTLKDFAAKSEWPLSSKLAKCLIEMGALCERFVEEATFWKLVHGKEKP